jgi:hypothetical protein
MTDKDVIKSDEVKPVDLTDSQEVLSEDTVEELQKPASIPPEENVTPEDYGKEESAKIEGENLKDLTGDQNDNVTPEKLVHNYPCDPADPYEGRKKNIPVEVPITHFKNIETGNIFKTNEAISQQRHLRPCDKSGNLVPDTRTQQDLR